MSNSLTGFHHIGVITPDLAASVDLYTRLLGFHMVDEIDDRANSDCFITLVQLGELKIELIMPEPMEEGIVESAGASNNHFALYSTDIEADHKRLVNEGIKFELPAVRYVDDYGHPPKRIGCICFRGPGGERIELHQVF